MPININLGRNAINPGGVFGKSDKKREEEKRRIALQNAKYEAQQRRFDKDLVEAVSGGALDIPAADAIQRMRRDEQAKAEAEKIAAQQTTRMLEQPASVQAGLESRTGGMSPFERNVNIKTMLGGTLPQQQEVIDRMQLPVPDEGRQAREAAAVNIKDPTMRQLYVTGQITEQEAEVLPDKSGQAEKDFYTTAQLKGTLDAVRNEKIQIPVGDPDPFSGQQQYATQLKYKTDDEIMTEALHRYGQTEEFKKQASKDYGTEIESVLDQNERRKQEIAELKEMLQEMLNAVGGQ